MRCIGIAAATVALLLQAAALGVEAMGLEALAVRCFAPLAVGAVLCLAVTSLPFAAIAVTTGSRKEGRRWLLGALALSVTLFLAIRAQSWIRSREFAALARRSEPLLAAIEAFSRERGHAPALLTDLVPEYLKEVPGTGHQAYPAYRYTQSVAAAGGRYELLVDCPKTLLSFDVFFFWPGGGYPSEVYGGVVERIGRWAYVHE